MERAGRPLVPRWPQVKRLVLEGRAPVVPATLSFAAASAQAQYSASAEAWYSASAQARCSASGQALCIRIARVNRRSCTAAPPTFCQPHLNNALRFVHVPQHRYSLAKPPVKFGPCANCQHCPHCSHCAHCAHCSHCWPWPALPALLAVALATMPLHNSQCEGEHWHTVACERALQPVCYNGDTVLQPVCYNRDTALQPVRPPSAASLTTKGCDHKTPIRTPSAACRAPRSTPNDVLQLMHAGVPQPATPPALTAHPAQPYAHTAARCIDRFGAAPRSQALQHCPSAAALPCHLPPQAPLPSPAAALPQSPMLTSRLAPGHSRHCPGHAFAVGKWSGHAFASDAQPAAEHYVSAMPATQHYVSAMPAAEHYVSAIPATQHYVSAMPAAEHYVSAMPATQHYVSAIPAPLHPLALSLVSQHRYLGASSAVAPAAAPATVVDDAIEQYQSTRSISDPSIAQWVRDLDAGSPDDQLLATMLRDAPAADQR